MIDLSAWKPSAGSRAVIFGGWVIAALAILGVNLQMLGGLYAPPADPESPLVYSLRLKLHRCEQLIAARTAAAVRERPLRLASASSPPVQMPLLPEEAPQEDPRAPDPQPRLPKLTGILIVGGGGSGSGYAAVLDGGVFSTRETVNGFKIEQIDAGGVRLSQNRRSWLIPAPEVYYSVERPK